MTALKKDVRDWLHAIKNRTRLCNCSSAEDYLELIEELAAIACAWRRGLAPLASLGPPAVWIADQADQMVAELGEAVARLRQILEGRP